MKKMDRKNVISVNILVSPVNLKIYALVVWIQRIEMNYASV